MFCPIVLKTMPTIVDHRLLLFLQTHKKQRGDLLEGSERGREIIQLPQLPWVDEVSIIIEVVFDRVGGKAKKKKTSLNSTG